MKIGKELLERQLSKHIQDKNIGMMCKSTARQREFFDSCPTTVNVAYLSAET